MTDRNVLAELQEVFDEVFLDPVTVTPELTAMDVAEWDSLMHISLMMAVESRFGLQFRTGEVEAIHNVGEFAELIRRRLS